MSYRFNFINQDITDSQKQNQFFEYYISRIK